MYGIIYVWDSTLTVCNYNSSDVDIIAGGASQSKRKITTTRKPNYTTLSTFFLSFPFLFICFLSSGIGFLL